jgi:hypothetical protein
MLKHRILAFILVFILTGCNTHPAANTGGDSTAKTPATGTREQITDPAETLTIDPATQKRYQDAFAHDTVSYDKKFAASVGPILQQFNGRKLDTTVLTIGDLAGESTPDTIYSRIYYARDTVFVASTWIKNNQVLWQDKYIDPYSSLDTNLFRDTSRNTWLYFAIGVVYGAPDILPRDKVDTSVLNLVYQIGLEELKKLGIHTDKAHYRAYLQAFKGQLLTFGKPESREGVWIWYKPAGKMISYYQP